MVCAIASSPFKGDPRDIDVAGPTVAVMIAYPLPGSGACLIADCAAKMKSWMLLQTPAVRNYSPWGVNEPRRQRGGGRQPIGRPLEGCPCGPGIESWPRPGPEP